MSHEELSHHQLDQIRTAFDDIDANNDGVISLDELTEYLLRSGDGGWTSERIQQAFQLADADRNGTIDLAEFTALMSRSMRRYVEEPREQAH